MSVYVISEVATGISPRFSLDRSLALLFSPPSRSYLYLCCLTHTLFPTPTTRPGPEVAEQLEVYQKNLKEKTRQMKAMTSELDMYKAQVSEYKFEIEGLLTEQKAVKAQYFAIMRRERDVGTASALGSIMNSRGGMGMDSRGGMESRGGTRGTSGMRTASGGSGYGVGGLGDVGAAAGAAGAEAGAAGDVDEKQGEDGVAETKAGGGESKEE